jgi:predicted GNAT family N-acyltransferase
MNDRAIFSHAVSVIALNALYKASNDSGRAAPHETLIGLELNQQLVCGARLIAYASHQSDQPQWLLRNLCTVPAFRGQRLASLLLQNAQQHVQQQMHGQPLITLPLPHLNDFYQRNGFTPIATSQLCPALQQVLRQSRRRHKGIQAMVSQPQLG